MELEEVNISLAVGKVYSGRFELLSLSPVFIVLSSHKRASQCPDVMEIEIQSKIREQCATQRRTLFNQGKVLNSLSASVDGNETTPGVMIYGLHQAER